MLLELLGGPCLCARGSAPSICGASRPYTRIYDPPAQRTSRSSQEAARTHYKEKGSSMKERTQKEGSGITLPPQMFFSNNTCCSYPNLHGPFISQFCFMRHDFSFEKKCWLKLEGDGGIAS